MARYFELPAGPDTVHWGYFDDTLPPRLEVGSGDIVRVETLNPVHGPYPERAPDPAERAVYEQVRDRGPGPHILTGPIAVAGAGPGDALEVRVLALDPRHPVGTNALTAVGLLPEESPGRAGTELRVDPATGRARALFRFDFPVDGPAPGVAWDVPRSPSLGGVAVPVRLHLGVAGVAPGTGARIGSREPGRFGGNMDQRRFGPGTAMTYPVLVPGARFSCGDGHLAQGDGEVSGTAIEGGLTATLQFVLHRERAVGNPVLETPTHWVVHAFAQTLDEAARLAGLEAIAFLGTRGLDRRDAYTLLSIAGDFGITQAVNGTKGVHVKLRRDMFAPAG